jgi:FMN reductase
MIIGGSGLSTSQALVERIDRAAGELADLVSGPPAAVVVDPFDNLTPFDALLRGV